MKKIILIVCAMCPMLLAAQNVAYLSSDSVLKSVPEYGVKMQKFDSIRQSLTKELETKQNLLQQQYEKLIKPYSPGEKEVIAQLKKRMSAVDTLSLNMLIEDDKQLQSKKQTYDRILQTTYNSEVQPVLNRVNGVVEAYASENKLTAVFILEQMRSSLAYIDPRQNITAAIIGRLRGKDLTPNPSPKARGVGR